MNKEEYFLQLVRDGVFEVDNAGRIWRCKVVKRGPSGTRVFKPCDRRRAEHPTGPHDYLQVFIHRDGKSIFMMAHRLVYAVMHGPIPDGFDVNHENGLKDDNRPENLTAATASENKRHADRTGLRDQHGQRNPACRLTDNQVAQIRLAYSRGGFTMAQLAKRFGVAFQTISRIIRGQRRPKQGGPTASGDLRHSVSPRDPETGRYLSNRTHDELAWEVGR